MIDEDRRLTVGKLEHGIGESRVRRLITEDLKMICGCAKIIPKWLRDEQKNLGVEIVQDDLKMVDNYETLFSRHFLRC